MTVTPSVNSSEQTDECGCPSGTVSGRVTRRDRLDGVDLAALQSRVGHLRFPAPATVIGVEIAARADATTS